MKFLTTDYSASEKVGHYRIDVERRIRIEEYQGKTGLNDLKSILLSMASDPCWSAEFHGLIDLSEAELELTANDVLRLALVLRHEANRTHGWLAYVATKSTTYGIIRMLGYWSRNTQRVRIFQTRLEAEAWLEMNIDQVPPGFIHEEDVPVLPVLRNVI